MFMNPYEAELNRQMAIAKLAMEQLLDALDDDDLVLMPIEEEEEFDRIIIALDDD